MKYAPLDPCVAYQKIFQVCLWRINRGKHNHMIFKGDVLSDPPIRSKCGEWQTQCHLIAVESVCLALQPYLNTYHRIAEYNRAYGR